MPIARRLSRQFTLFLALAALGCGSGAEPRPDGEITPGPAPAAYGEGGIGSLPAGFPDSPDRYLGEGSAPTPYTAEQLRRFSGEGRIDKWQVHTSKGEFIKVQRVLESDARGARIQTFLTTSDGVQSGSSEAVIGTWQEFQSHASYPAQDTIIKTERITVPAGSFDCWVYEVKEKESLLTFWFPKDVPGPPVRVRIDKRGRTDLEMQLVECLAGKPLP